MSYPGYTFKGWSTGGTDVLPDNKLPEINGNVSLTAIWEQNT